MGKNNEKRVCTLEEKPDIKTSPPDRPKEMNRCPYCGMRFESAGEMIRHVFRMHAT